jgi:hypothetical protein
MPAAPRSQFVTITAWLSLALALVGVLTGLLQAAMFIASPPDQGLLAALTAGGSGVALPPALVWMFEHIGLLLLASLLSSVLLAVASWGLLQRREWGRFGFIALLAGSALLTLAGAFAFDGLMGDLNARAGFDSANVDPLLANLQAAMRMAIYAAALLIGILHGAIVWKLCTPAVRAEFH